MNRLVTEDTVFWWKLICHHQPHFVTHPVCRYRKGTTNSRDQHQVATTWWPGLHYALNHNIQYWQVNFGALTSQQILTISRVLEKFASLAVFQDEVDIAHGAYALADRFVRSALPLSPGLIIRRMLGTKRYSHLRSLR